jgi:8-oxo-dGTP diphosphatase
MVSDSAGRILIGQRPDGTLMAGFWEFPGGKLMAGELPFAGLQRELGEELGIEVVAAEPFFRHSHRYPDRHVRLDVWWVLDYAGQPESREGQSLRWVEVGDLDREALLPADEPIVAAIRQRGA